MEYAIDYAVVGRSKVIAWEKGKEKKKKILFLKGKKKKDSKKKVKRGKKPEEGKEKGIEKKKFLEKLTPEDTLWMELGGASDNFCLGALQKGASILRIPSIKVKQAKNGKNGEEGKKVDTAKLLREFALSNPQNFYPVREIDEQLLEIRLLTQNYYFIQKSVRIPIEQRMGIAISELELVKGRKGEILSDIIYENFQQFQIPERLLTLEEKILPEIESKLKRMALWQAVFEPIEGLGPVAGSYIIGEILDIRRFPSFSSLKAYANYHLFLNPKDKWEAYRRAAKYDYYKPVNSHKKKLLGEPWNHMLHQGIWMFTEQIYTYGKDSNPWKQMLKGRLEYEQSKIPDDYFGTSEKEKGRWFWWMRNRAQRWLGQKTLQYIWYQWRRFEGIAEEHTPKVPIQKVVGID